MWPHNRPHLAASLVYAPKTPGQSQTPHPLCADRPPPALSLSHTKQKPTTKQKNSLKGVNNLTAIWVTRGGKADSPAVLSVNPVDSQASYLATPNAGDGTGSFANPNGSFTAASLIAPAGAGGVYNLTQLAADAAAGLLSCVVKTANSSATNTTGLMAGAFLPGNATTGLAAAAAPTVTKTAEATLAGAAGVNATGKCTLELLSNGAAKFSYT